MRGSCLRTFKVAVNLEGLIITEGICPKSHQDMRYSRHWFLLPFLVNVAFLFSATWLINSISQMTAEYMWYPMPSWILFATIAVCVPSSLVITRVLPDPSIALFIGGLLTAVGLLWTWLKIESAQMVPLYMLSGSGVSLSIQATSVAISPFFIRDNITASLGTLLLSAFTMLIMCPLATYANEGTHSIFLYLCLATLVSSLIPLLVYLHLKRKLCIAQPEKLLHMKPSADPFALPEKLIQMKHENDVTSGSVKDDSKLMFTNNGWGMCFITSVVWLSWGAGVDTTWLSLGWQLQYFNTPTGLASLQLLLCFVLLIMKICMELSQPCTTSYYRNNLASNYMQLGLLGTSGLILCLFPEHSMPFHNHLLFTAGLALQYDDLSGQCLVRSRRLSMTVFQHNANKPNEDEKEGSSLMNWCCIVCFVASVFLMSLVTMILGIQLANGLGYLTTLPPLTFICSRGGLVVMSVAAVCVSLARPHRWVLQTDHIQIL